MLCVCVCKKVCVIIQVFFRVCSNHSYCLFCDSDSSYKNTNLCLLYLNEKKKKEEKNTNKCVHVEN